MTAAVATGVYRCRDLEVDVRKACVRRGGVELPLRQKAFQVLVLLIENRDRVVERQELLDTIWSGISVTDDNLVQCLVEIRRAVDEDAHSPWFIRTVPRRGYRFIAEIENDAPAPAPAMTLAIESTESIELDIVEEVDDDVAVQVHALPATRAFLWRVVIAAACAVAIGVAVLAAFKLREPQRAPIPIRTTSVAVLFFENRTARADADWLREGIADMIITGLSRSSEMKVVSREQLSVMLRRARTRAGERSLSALLPVVRSAGAQRVVSGSFTVIGNEIRIDAQIHDPANGSLIAGDTLVVASGQLLTRIDSLTERLAAHLEPARATAPSQHVAYAMTDNLEAYRLYSQGLERAEVYHNDQAIALFQQAIDLDPNFAMAWARIGYVYGMTAGRPVDAQPYLARSLQLSERLSEKNRMDVAVWSSVANFNYADAIQRLHIIIDRYPNDVEAYTRLGVLLTGEDQGQQAVSVFERALVIDPNVPEIHNHLGGVLSDLGRHEEAIRARRRYVDLLPLEPNSWDSLGLSLDWAGRYDEAIKAFERGLAIDPDFNLNLVHLANAYAHTGRYREAVQMMKRHLQLARTDLDKKRAHATLAFLHRDMGNMHLAIESARAEAALHGDFALKALGLVSPESNASRASARGSRGFLRPDYYDFASDALRRGDAQRAIELFRETLRHEPPIWFVESYETCLGDGYLQLGRNEEAVHEYQRILALNPNYGLARYGLAKACDALGKHDEAKLGYERFLATWKSADPDLPQIIDARQRLNVFRASM